VVCGAAAVKIIGGDVMRIRSAVDFKNEALVFISIGFITAGALYLSAAMGFSMRMALIGYATAVIASAFLLWFLFGTYYELHKDYLYCKCGPFTEVIRYDDIVYLRLGRSTSSSLALSAKRIGIWQCRDGVMSETMISPKNRALFMARLKARCRYLEDAA
jgi:hypothetical protein